MRIHISHLELRVPSAHLAARARGLATRLGTLEVPGRGTGPAADEIYVQHLVLRLPPGQFDPDAAAARVADSLVRELTDSLEVRL